LGRIIVEEKKVKNGKLKKFLTYAGVVALILAAIIISLLFYRQKIETTNTVFKNLTEDWQTFDTSQGFSFKYPKDWEVVTGKWEIGDNLVSYIISKKDDKDKKDAIYLTVRNYLVNERSIKDQEPEYAIQISIPFGKSYMIFSTSTDNDLKEIFYNIPVTLEFKK